MHSVFKFGFASLSLAAAAVVVLAAPSFAWDTILYSNPVVIDRGYTSPVVIERPVVIDSPYYMRYDYDRPFSLGRFLGNTLDFTKDVVTFPLDVLD